MDNGNGKASDDMVLETRHLVGIFFGVVVLCAIAFTLGFVYGRNQERATRSAELQASAEKPAPAPGETPSSPAPTDLGFYDRVGTPKPATPSGKTPSPKPAAKPATSKPAAPKPTTTTASKSAPATAAPIFLQVAAVSQKAEAERLSKELRRLGFSSVIVPPKSDRLYRVQVGPFATQELASAAQERLKAQGYKTIVRR